MRTAHRCRAYPDAEQQQMLNRTFGCVRVVWNRTLVARHARWQAERTSTSYAQADAALTQGSANRGKAAAKVARAHRKVRCARRDFLHRASTCLVRSADTIVIEDLSTRHWTCPSCGARHDRDINAAKNILAAGLAVSACGADIRHRETPPVRSAVKQEPQTVTAGIPVLRGGRGGVFEFLLGRAELHGQGHELGSNRTDLASSRRTG